MPQLQAFFKITVRNPEVDMPTEEPGDGSF
jgi:hypothetical protein